IVSSLDQGHRRNDGFVEIIASGAGAAALNLDAGRIGTEYKYFAFCHIICPFFTFCCRCSSVFYNAWRTPFQKTEIFAPRCLRYDGASHSMAVRDLPRTQLSEEILSMAAFTCSALWALTMRRFARSADRRGAGPRMAAVLGRRSSARPTRWEHAVPFPVAAKLAPSRLSTPP